jgi:hypothetical protein
MINIERSCNYDVKFVATNNHVNLGTEKKITSLVVFLYNLYAGEKVAVLSLLKQIATMNHT